VPVVGGHVFISYRHAEPDTAYVEKLATFLDTAGIGVWLDRDIVSGDRWHALIEQQINTSVAVVVVMSPQASESRWVNREISQAELADKPIFPLLLAGKRFFRLADLHYDDVTDGQMPSAQVLVRLRDLLPEQPTDAQIPAPPARFVDTLTVHTGPVLSVVWSPDGRHLATTSHDRTVRIWEPATGTMLRTLTGHTYPVLSVVWSPNGRHLASGGDDRTARIWLIPASW
jgi:WD40 repeat protein